MNAHALAVLFVVAAWWLSTCLVLRMVWAGRSSAVLVLASVLAVAALVGIYATRGGGGPGAAYAAFACALMVWGWHELTFLLGIVTGPRKAPCPADARGVRRFAFATATLLHHELALAATVLLIVAITWGAPNPVALWTFLVLWVMRLSAKLNVYLGVRNLSEQFVPDHLRYLVSYFRRARFNALMPISLIGGTAVVLRLVVGALAPDATPFDVAGRTLVASILALAVIEHVFLALPLPDAALWSWVIRNKQVQGENPLPSLGTGAP